MGDLLSPACRRERAEVPAACRRGPKAPLPSVPCPAGPLPASGCPQLAQGERRASPIRLRGSGARGRVRRCLKACGSCHGSCSSIGAGGISSPVYLSVYDSHSQEGKGLAQGCLVFCARSFLAGLQRRLVPVLSLSSWEPWAFDSLCVWGRSGGHPEAPAQGSFLCRSTAGGSGHLVRYGRWKSVLTLLSPARATGVAWLRGSFGSVLSSCSTGAWLCSGVPCGGHCRAVSGDEGWGGDVGSAGLSEVGVLFGAPRCP